MEQVMRFMCTNLAKLDNAAELLTVEDLEVVLMREDVNCTTDGLLLFLHTSSAFKSLPDDQKANLETMVQSVSRKPPEVLISVGGWDSAPSRTTWFKTSPNINLPVPLAYHGMETVNN